MLESHADGPLGTPPRRALEPVTGLQGVLLRLVLRIGTGIAAAVARLAARRRRQALSSELSVLATAAFSSPNWIRAHLEPIVGSSRCREVVLVATDQAPGLPGLRVCRPSARLVAVTGATAARLLTFLWLGVRDRPHVLVGFHLLVNGLLAIVAARVLGRHSIYFCGGGESEVAGGGAFGENRIFGRLPDPDPVIERRLLAVVGRADIVVTMGSRAARYLSGRCAPGRIVSLPGGHHGHRTQTSESEKVWDCIFVGRLVQVKRLDTLLRAFAIARTSLPQLSAVIVGDGPLRQELEALAHELGLSQAVEFAGRQTNVCRWLERSRLFVLTSDSEGVPLAVMEAFSVGLPAVASSVGDVADLVRDGVNGALVETRSPMAFAEAIVGLLGDPVRLRELALGARTTAADFEPSVVAQRWDRLFDSIAAPGGIA